MRTVDPFEFTYDTIGRLMAAGDIASQYTYAYDNLSRLTGSTQAMTGLAPDILLGYDYDLNGDRTELTADFDTTSGVKKDLINSYTYDPLRQLTQVTQDAQTGGTPNAVADKRVDFTYKQTGAFESISRYKDTSGTNLIVQTDFGYDIGGRLTDLTHWQDTETHTLSPYADYDFTYDRTWAIKAVDITSNATSATNGLVTYEYDTHGGLVEADYDNTAVDHEEYELDTAGNRDQVTYGSTPNEDVRDYVPGSYNQMRSDGIYAYTYDKDGNRTARFDDDDSDGTISSGDLDITIYDWDYRNRLTGVTHYANYTGYSGGTSDEEITYTYDYADRLIHRTRDPDGDGGSENIEETAFVYDGAHILLQFDRTGGSGDLADSDLSHRYLYGPAIDQVLADEAVSSLTSPGAVFWPLADNLGSVRDIVDSNQTLRTHLFYDAYGNVTSRDEYDSGGNEIIAGNWESQAIDHWFTYTARLYDEDADLYNLRARWYDAATGQFVNPDSIGFAGGDANLYRYVANNPVNHTDPSGLSGGSGGAGGGCIPSNRQGITFLDSPGNGYSNRLQVEAFRNRQSWVHSNVPWQHQTTEMHRYLDALVQDGATLAPELLEWSRGAGLRFDSYELEEAILVMGAHTAALHEAHDAAALARNRDIFFIRVGGAFQFVAGVGEASFGTFLGTLGVAAEAPSLGTSTVLVVLGYGFAFNGVDNAAAGAYSLWTGEQKDTLTEQAIEEVTGSRTLATSANNAALTVGNIGNPARAMLGRTGSALRNTSRSVGRTACGDARMAANRVGSAEQGGLNLFKWKDATSLRGKAWREGDRFLYLPNRGSFKANWAQNSGRLRAEMRSGQRIFDSYLDDAGNMIPAGNGTFLNAERYLLESSGWKFSPSTGAWHPPAEVWRIR